MILRQTLKNPVYGYWDGGLKQIFDWEIDYFHQGKDKKGTFVKIGSWEANHWFHVSLGKTEEQTLQNTKKHLQKSTRYPSTFKYIK